MCLKKRNSFLFGSVEQNCLTKEIHLSAVQVSGVGYDKSSEYLVLSVSVSVLPMSLTFCHIHRTELDKSGR